MLREESVKLIKVPVLGSLGRVVAALRGLPLPKPLQRLTERGLSRLRKAVPALAELLDGEARATPGPTKAVRAPLGDLMRQLVASDYRARLRSVQALAHHRDKLAIDALGGALRDRSVEVAVAAVSSLQIVAGVGARPTLLTVLQNEQRYYHPLVRAAAVHALGALLVEAECAPIIAALRDGDAEVSIAAISALGASAPRRAGELLLEVVENREGFFLPITRLAAARGLERLSGLSSARLTRAAEGEQDPQLAEILARAAERQRS